MTMAQIPTATPAYDLHNEDVVDCQVIDTTDTVSVNMEKCDVRDILNNFELNKLILKILYIVR